MRTVETVYERVRREILEAMDAENCALVALGRKLLSMGDELKFGEGTRLMEELHKLRSPDKLQAAIAAAEGRLDVKLAAHGGLGYPLLNKLGRNPRLQKKLLDGNIPIRQPDDEVEYKSIFEMTSGEIAQAISPEGAIIKPEKQKVKAKEKKTKSKGETFDGKDDVFDKVEASLSTKFVHGRKRSAVERGVEDMIRNLHKHDQLEDFEECWAKTKPKVLAEIKEKEEESKEDARVVEPRVAPDRQ